VAVVGCPNGNISDDGGKYWWLVGKVSAATKVSNQRPVLVVSD